MRGRRRACFRSPQDGELWRVWLAAGEAPVRCWQLLECWPRRGAGEVLAGRGEAPVRCWQNNVELFSGRSAGPGARKLSGNKWGVAELLSCGPRRSFDESDPVDSDLRGSDPCDSHVRAPGVRPVGFEWYGWRGPRRAQGLAKRGARGRTFIPRAAAVGRACSPKVLLCSGLLFRVPQAVRRRPRRAQGLARKPVSSKR